jgi:hypothetical protein
MRIDRRIAGALVALTAAAVVAAITAPTAAHASSPPDWSSWKKIENIHSGLCLNAQGYDTGDAMHMYGCSDRWYPNAYIWHLIPNPNGVDGFELDLINELSLTDSGKCLTAPTWNGNNPILYPCQGNGDQIWYLNTITASTEIQNANSNLCLDAPDWANFATIMYSCAQFADEEWQPLPLP